MMQMHAETLAGVKRLDTILLGSWPAPKQELFDPTIFSNLIGEYRLDTSWMSTKETIAILMPPATGY
jgi:hypothetical protein